MPNFSVRKARQILTKYRKNLKKETSAYDRALKLVRKLHAQMLAAEASARTIAERIEDAERWVAVAGRAVEDAKLLGSRKRKNNTAALARSFKAAVAKIPEVTGSHGAAYVKQIEKQAAAKAKVRALAMKLAELDDDNRDYWQRQYDRYSG
jgi:hypothetical protein